MSSQNTVDRDLETTWESLEEGVKRAVIALKDFTAQQEKDFQYVISLSASDLGIFLKDFYTHLRSHSEDDGNALSNLHRIRADLNEYFKKVSDVDIMKGSEFTECNALLDENVCKEVGTKTTIMKKHSRQRTFTFETNELRQIYLSDAMNLDQPETLQNKVFFDICMYICNRGKDFLRLMTKNDFEVSNDQTGRRYVWLKFNSKFSFNEVAGGTTSDSVKGSQIGERMYERPGDPKCPVLSYTQYVIHLHPMSDAFWQRPKRSVLPTDFVWYDNQCLGNSTLNKLMNRITQSAGLPDSYAINAIKSSYIPIIESICRSALFGSQQFRRILHMKQLPHDMHYVRKRHSEGSLSIASQLRESSLFRPRHSEPQLPVYCGLGKLDTDHLTRSNSSSPVTRGSSWDSGSPHMYMGKTPERVDVSQESGFQPYRNCDSDIQGYKQNFRDTGQDDRGPDLQNHIKAGATSSSMVDEERKRPETGSILEAKLKCLDIVHSLEVRDIKSFINWMKTFEVKHESSGLMVTCQPVNEMQPKQQQIARTTEHNGMNGCLENSNRDHVQRRNSGLNMVNEQLFEAKDLDFDCIGDTFCCTSDISPMKITIPAQDTLILTGLQPDTQVLVHRNMNEEKPVLEQKYIPMHLRVFTSSDKFSLQNVKSMFTRKNVTERQNSESNSSQDNVRTSFKEEKSIPMKKRIVIDQSEPSHSSPISGSPQSYPISRSPPQSFSSRHSSPLTYMSPQQQQQQQQYNHTVGRPSGLISEQHPALSQANTFAMNQGPPMSHPPPSSMTVSPVPKYRERFPDGWGYIPLQKRQKFGLHPSSPKNEGPLDLIKQS